MRSTIIILMSLAILSYQDLHSQVLNPTKQYKVWVYSKPDMDLTRGMLNKLKDSSVMISLTPSFSKSGETLQEINFENIKSLKVRTKGRIGRGAVIGALSGFAVGGLIGLSGGDDECSVLNIFCLTAEEKAVLYGIPLSLTGAIFGAVIGSAKIKIPIRSNRENLMAKRRELDK